MRLGNCSVLRIVSGQSPRSLRPVGLLSNDGALFSVSFPEARRVQAGSRYEIDNVLKKIAKLTSSLAALYEKWTVVRVKW